MPSKLEPAAMETTCINRGLRHHVENSSTAIEISHNKLLHHVLLIPFPCQGHINPIMELGKRLASLGIVTTLATIHTFVARFQNASSSHPITNHHINEVRIASHDNKSFVSVVGIPDGLPPEYDRDIVDHHFGAAIQNNLEGALVELVHSLSRGGCPITCLIGDFYLSWIPHLAHVLNLPEFVFWPQNASNYAIYSHIDLIISNGYNPFKGNATTFGPKEAMDLVSCIPGMDPMHPSELPFETRAGQIGLSWLENVIRTRFGELNKAMGVLGNSFHELEPKVCEALGPKFFAIGPLTPLPSLRQDLNTGHSEVLDYENVSLSASLWEEDECIQWLDEQPPKSVVYVSFGSLSKYSMAQIRELAKGIASSKQRFLWVIRKNTVFEEVGNVAEALPKGFLEEVKGRGKVINWAPQTLVLAHRSVGGFFSHCGWNSTMESLSLGVPILGWPFMGDQVTNCLQVCNQWKVGLKVEVNQDNIVGHLEVERCLKALMEGEEARSMRARSTALKHAAQQSILSAFGSSQQNLKHFVSLLTTPAF